MHVRVQLEKAGLAQRLGKLGVLLTWICWTPAVAGPPTCSDSWTDLIAIADAL